MPNGREMAFVFDDWKELAETNPQQFEKKRKNMIDEIISSTPEHHRHRLEGLQWRIDMERKRSSNPMSACVRISSMMLDSLYGDKGLVMALNGECKRYNSKNVAQVISLGNKGKKNS